MANKETHRETRSSRPNYRIVNDILNIHHSSNHLIDESIEWYRHLLFENNRISSLYNLPPIKEPSLLKEIEQFRDLRNKKLNCIELTKEEKEFEKRMAPIMKFIITTIQLSYVKMADRNSEPEACMAMEELQDILLYRNIVLKKNKKLRDEYSQKCNTPEVKEALSLCREDKVPEVREVLHKVDKVADKFRQNEYKLYKAKNKGIVHIPKELSPEEYDKLVDEIREKNNENKKEG